MAAPPSKSPELLNPYTIPFVVFIALTAVTEFIPGGTYVIYPLKTLLGLGLLWYYRKSYAELTVWQFHWSAFPVGLLVLALWIGLDNIYPKLSEAPGFNPFTTGNITTDWLTVALRLGGSFLVVPILEELFWRAWLLRFLIDQEDYQRVALGTFTWVSFVLANLLFGLEHDRWLAGILASMIYSGLVYWRKEIRTSIVAHSVTNLGLGIYVLLTQTWSFW